jgi:hypothetical protein
LGFAEQVVGESPKLGDHKYVENSHPNKENNSLVRSGLSREIKSDQLRDKENCHPGDQFEPGHTRRESAVGRHNKHQQNGLGGGRVAFHLSPALGEDEGFAHRLKQVVRGQQESQVDG